MVADLTPIVGYGGDVTIGSIDLSFKNWSLSSDGASIDVTAANVGGGYAMFIPGIVSYTADIEIDVDVSQTDMGSLEPGDTFETITFNKASEDPFVSFTNAVEATSVVAGFVTDVSVSCPVDGVLTASISVQLNGAPTFA